MARLDKKVLDNVIKFNQLIKERNMFIIVGLIIVLLISAFLYWGWTPLSIWSPIKSAISFSTNSPFFTVSLKLSDLKIVKAKGKSIREAEKNTAKKALALLGIE